jgi:hypothetical protein
VTPHSAHRPAKVFDVYCLGSIGGCNTGLVERL